MKKEYEVKSEEVLNILEKYREKLKINRYNLCFNENYNKKWYLKIDFKSDFSKYDFERVPEGTIEIEFSKERNILKLGTDAYYGSGGQYLVFEDLDKLKDIVSLIEELKKINYLELNEFKEYTAMKDKQRELEEEKNKIETELEKQKEEIENKLKELKGDDN